MERSYYGKSGHIGSNLSIADLVWCLYDSVFNARPTDFSDKKNNNERDRFVLSKGHPSLALFVALYLKGFITKDELDTYCKHDGTLLGAHPKHYIRGVDFSTGSLGTGITFAVGCSLAAKIQKSLRKTYCLISDGEINEGSCWEALTFAGAKKLDNLVLLYDNNKQQALDLTKNIIDLNKMNDIVKILGFDVMEINGHDHDEIKRAIAKAKFSDRPVFINAHTICGKGISFMENTIEWHYKSMTEEQYMKALSEI